MIPEAGSRSALAAGARRGRGRGAGARSSFVCLCIVDMNRSWMKNYVIRDATRETGEFRFAKQKLCASRVPSRPASAVGWQGGATRPDAPARAWSVRVWLATS